MANNAQPPRTAFIHIMLGRLMPTANCNGDVHLTWFARPETGIFFVSQQATHLRTNRIKHKSNASSARLTAPKLKA
jgi:hypothetical protein